MQKKKLIQNQSAQTLFDVPSIKRDISESTKKKISGKVILDISRIGLNAAWEKDGNALKNRSNSI